VKQELKDEIIRWKRRPKKGEETYHTTAACKSFLTAQKLKHKQFFKVSQHPLVDKKVTGG